MIAVKRAVVAASNEIALGGELSRRRLVYGEALRSSRGSGGTYLGLATDSSELET